MPMRSWVWNHNPKSWVGPPEIFSGGRWRSHHIHFESWGRKDICIIPGRSWGYYTCNTFNADAQEHALFLEILKGYRP